MITRQWSIPDGFHTVPMLNSCVAMNSIGKSKNRNEQLKVCLLLMSRNSLLFLIERAQANQSGRNENDHSTNRSRLLIPDESTLSRLVAARLDLPISQNLLNQNFKLSIIKRCWEDQLRLKRKR
jgi:hypothetical protein